MMVVGSEALVAEVDRQLAGRGRCGGCSGSRHFSPASRVAV